MNIAFVSNVVYPFVTGGAQKRIHEIGSRLADRGHTVTVYGRHFWDGPEETVHEGMTLRAVSPAREIYNGERRSITEALEFAVDLLSPLWRHIASHDVVVASVFPYFPVLACLPSTKLRGTPLVTTWHEVWGDYWNEYLGTLGPLGQAVEYLTANAPQHPVAVSEVTAKRLAELGPTRDRIKSIPNGIDYDQIRDIDPVSDGFDVLFAGRLIEEKRVDNLLAAFDQVASPDTTLGIIGDGPEKDTLERQAATLDSSSRITFLGFLEEYEDVLAHMRTADIFASPSTREGFGITYAEAMAADCTVIGADHSESAADEVIQDGGFLVESNTSKLATVLEDAIAGHSPAAHPRMVAQEFDWDQVALLAEETYQAAVQGDW